MSMAFLFSGALLAQAVSPPPAFQTARGSAELKWLVDLGAESLVASPRASASNAKPVVISIPGAAYVLSVGVDGSVQKRKRLAVDPSAPYGVAVTDGGLALATKEGSLELWTFSPAGELSLRWRRSLGERATSVGWDGGEALLVATWGNRLTALSATDGRSLWSVDIGGRAEAPPAIEGKSVFVATKASTLFHVDATTGRVRWRVGLPGLARHPLAFLGKEPRLVVCGTWDGHLYAYGALSGQVRWSVTLPAKLAGAPVATADLVASITADGNLQSYDPSGRSLWMQPGASEGAATLLLQSGRPERLVVVSKMLVGVDLGTGARLADYPKGAADELRRRFADAMLEGVKTYSESEKHALLARDAFDLTGPPFGPVRLVGPDLAFGTEEGWAYVFDASTLRPLGRYHAGQPCSAGPRLAAGRVVAVAGEEAFGIDPDTGRTMWRRALGGDAQRLVGESTLGLVTGERVHALNPTDGIPRWSLRGRLRSVAPPRPGPSASTPWLADDGEGHLRSLWPPGRLGEESLAVEGELLPVLEATERSWVAATREGRVLVVNWEGDAPSGSRLVTGWEKTFEGRLADVRVAGERMVVRSEAGWLVGLDESHHEMWRLRLSSEDRFEVFPEAGSLLIMGPADLRVHDWASGEMRLLWKVESPAVGAQVAGGFLVWLDRAGRAHRMDAREARLLETTDLGAPLAAATPTKDGFLVTTTAGEVGLVHVATTEPPRDSKESGKP